MLLLSLSSLPQLYLSISSAEFTATFEEQVSQLFKTVLSLHLLSCLNVF